MRLYTSEEYLALLKEISMKVDFRGLYDLCLRVRPNMVQFYDSSRLYGVWKLVEPLSV